MTPLKLGPAQSSLRLPGNATATSLGQADLLNGTLRQKLSASVAASQYVVGRNSGGSSNACWAVAMKTLAICEVEYGSNEGCANQRCSVGGLFDGWFFGDAVSA